MMHQKKQLKSANQLLRPWLMAQVKMIISTILLPKEHIQSLLPQGQFWQWWGGEHRRHQAGRSFGESQNTSIQFITNQLVIINPQKEKHTKKCPGLTQTVTEPPVKQSRKNNTKKVNQVHHLDTINLTSFPRVNREELLSIWWTISIERCWKEGTISRCTLWSCEQLYAILSWPCTIWWWTYPPQA